MYLMDYFSLFVAVVLTYVFYMCFNNALHILDTTIDTVYGVCLLILACMYLALSVPINEISLWILYMTLFIPSLGKAIWIKIKQHKNK